MDAPVTPHSSADFPGESKAWVSASLSAMLARHGIPLRHQATEIAQICAISISQARRKLRGSVWLFDEVHGLCHHFGERIDQVLAAHGHAPAPREPAGPGGAAYPATLLLGDVREPCEIELGPLLQGSAGPSTRGLVAIHHARDGWLVSSPAWLAQAGVPDAQRYAVEQLHWRQAGGQQRPRIAVLDDDHGSAEALTDWFNEVGYVAHAYTRAEDLLAQPLSAHDAFVVDLVLTGGQTSQAVVERIRHEQPQAPIVLLTGQLRGGAASESTLATLLRTHGVTFFEKPVRPTVLTAAIQNGLDRLVTTPHA